MCVIKIHAFTSIGRPPSWSGTIQKVSEILSSQNRLIWVSNQSTTIHAEIQIWRKMYRKKLTPINCFKKTTPLKNQLLGTNLPTWTFFQILLQTWGQNKNLDFYYIHAIWRIKRFAPRTDFFFFKRKKEIRNLKAGNKVNIFSILVLGASSLTKNAEANWNLKKKIQYLDPLDILYIFF